MTKKTKKPLRKKPLARIDLAATVSERVQLENILLLESTAKRKVLRDKLPPNISINTNVQTEADRKQGAVLVQIRFALVACFDDGSGDELLRIEAHYLLHYRMPSFSGIRKANIDSFGELNGMYNAWPFWREFVQATTVRMGFPALTIPVYRPATSESPRKKQPSRQAKPKSPTRKKHTTALAAKA